MTGNKGETKKDISIYTSKVERSGFRAARDVMIVKGTVKLLTV